MMKTGPLLINSVYFTEVSISASPGSKEADLNQIDLEIEPTVMPPPSNMKQWTVLLRVKIKSIAGVVAPYTGQIENIGLFVVDDKWPEAQAEKLVYINGAGILYASIREMVSLITSRGFFTPLTLPSCSFSQMFNEREEAKKAQAESKQAPAANPPVVNPTVL